MWKNLTKDLAKDVKLLSVNFVAEYSKENIQLCGHISSQAQTKITEMFKLLRCSQDHGEIPRTLGKNLSLGYLQPARTSDFHLFKHSRDSFHLNEELTLRDCANAIFHLKSVDFSLDDGKHWLMYITDKDKLVIMDIQRVCDVIITHA